MDRDLVYWVNSIPTLNCALVSGARDLEAAFGDVATHVLGAPCGTWTHARVRDRVARACPGVACATAPLVAALRRFESARDAAAAAAHDPERRRTVSPPAAPKGGPARRHVAETPAHAADVDGGPSSGRLQDDASRARHAPAPAGGSPRSLDGGEDGGDEDERGGLKGEAPRRRGSATRCGGGARAESTVRWTTQAAQDGVDTRAPPPPPRSPPRPPPAAADRTAAAARDVAERQVVLLSPSLSPAQKAVVVELREAVDGSYAKSAATVLLEAREASAEARLRRSVFVSELVALVVLSDGTPGSRAAVRVATCGRYELVATERGATTRAAAVANTRRALEALRGSSRLPMKHRVQACVPASAVVAGDAASLLAVLRAVAAALRRSPRRLLVPAPAAEPLLVEPLALEPPRRRRGDSEPPPPPPPSPPRSSARTARPPAAPSEPPPPPPRAPAATVQSPKKPAARLAPRRAPAAPRTAAPRAVLNPADQVAAALRAVAAAKRRLREGRRKDARCAVLSDIDDAPSDDERAAYDGAAARVSRAAEYEVKAWLAARGFRVCRASDALRDTAVNGSLVTAVAAAVSPRLVTADALRAAVGRPPSSLASARARVRAVARAAADAGGGHQCSASAVVAGDRGELYGLLQSLRELDRQPRAAEGGDLSPGRTHRAAPPHARPRAAPPPPARAVPWRLAYTDAQRARLATSLAAWLRALGLTDRDSLWDSARAFADGTLLCALAQRLTALRVRNGCAAARTAALERANVRKALALLRDWSVPLGWRHAVPQTEDGVCSGDWGVLLPLLEDCHRVFDGRAPGAARAAARPTGDDADDDDEPHVPLDFDDARYGDATRPRRRRPPPAAGHDRPAETADRGPPPPWTALEQTADLEPARSGGPPWQALAARASHSLPASPPAGDAPDLAPAAAASVRAAFDAGLDAAPEDGGARTDLFPRWPTSSPPRWPAALRDDLREIHQAACDRGIEAWQPAPLGRGSTS
ncbi:hypothetical protein M885DRAFT_536949 [Pelagophyceae sp. CCMP2097]|nr:hypothetical protein M885DRAFT_536949 [Pelagophyceae sp. CCMP2097]